MKLIFKLFLVIYVLVIVGCGSESNYNSGKTVLIESYFKTGSTLGVLARYSTGIRLLSTNKVSWEIASKPFTKTSAIPASDVEIRNVDYIFSPVNDGVSVPMVPTLIRFPTSLLVPANSKGNIDNDPIIGSGNMRAVCASGAPFSEYAVTVIFSGVEINTNTPVSTQSLAQVAIDCF